ncbi:MAG: EthD domain-containing protein [Pseudomonadota bacterium]
MEKLVFLFRRKPGATREDYFRHYITNHSPLGLKHQQRLDAYTVNLVESTADFDVVTEIWTPVISEFFGAGKQRSAGEELIVQDHMSFMGPQDTFAVAEQVVRDGPLTSPLGAASPGAKVVTIHRRGEALPEPAPGAHRVVDNVVLRTILLADKLAEPDASDIEVIRTSWADNLDALGPLPAGAVSVREYRWRTLADG